MNNWVLKHNHIR